MPSAILISLPPAIFIAALQAILSHLWLARSYIKPGRHPYACPPSNPERAPLVSLSSILHVSVDREKRCRV